MADIQILIDELVDDFKFVIELLISLIQQWSPACIIEDEYRKEVYKIYGKYFCE